MRPGGMLSSARAARSTGPRIDRRHRKSEGPTPEADRADAAESIVKEEPFADIDPMRAVFAKVPQEEVYVETARILVRRRGVG